MCWHRRECFSKFENFFFKKRDGEKFVNHSDVECFLRANFIAKHHQCGCFLKTDKSRQKKSSSAIRHESDFAKSLDECSVFRCDYDVTSKCNVCTGSGCYAIYSGEYRFFNGTDSLDDRIVMFFEYFSKSRVEFRIGDFFKILPGAKRFAGSGDYDGPNTIV